MLNNLGCLSACFRWVWGASGAEFADTRVAGREMTPNDLVEFVGCSHPWVPHPQGMYWVIDPKRCEDNQGKSGACKQVKKPGYEGTGITANAGNFSQLTSSRLPAQLNL